MYGLLTLLIYLTTSSDYIILPLSIYLLATSLPYTVLYNYIYTATSLYLLTYNCSFYCLLIYLWLTLLIYLILFYTYITTLSLLSLYLYSTHVHHLTDLSMSIYLLTFYSYIYYLQHYSIWHSSIHTWLQLYILFLYLYQTTILYLHYLYIYQHSIHILLIYLITRYTLLYTYPHYYILSQQHYLYT